MERDIIRNSNTTAGMEKDILQSNDNFVSAEKQGLSVTSGLLPAARG
jgi:hypothetical protein